MRGIMVLFAGLLVAACSSTPVMRVPVVNAPALVPVDPGRKLATIAFAKGVVTIPYGTVIAHFPSGSVLDLDATLCNHRYPRNAFYEWDFGRKYLGGADSDMSQAFYERLSAVGFSVTGDPKIMFGREREKSKASYLIGARITEVRGNLCEEHSGWDGRPLRRYAGEIYEKVEWSVYSVVLEKTVARFETEGYVKKRKASRQGIGDMLLAAFGNAAEALAAKKKFRDLLAVRQKEYDVDAGKRRYVGLWIADLPLSRRPVRRLTRQIVTGTVTIGTATGHGSGFLIASNGYILTNSHVVQESKEVAVIFSNGIKIAGRVRRADPVRDIALVKVDVRGIRPFPIRLEPKLKVFDTLYAVGTPIDRSLDATITKGIVSAFRTDEKTGLNYIQSNVDIAGGNSGGPLIDEFGNVVGVSVAGIGPKQFSSGLNLFIPIGDALAALNIRKKSERKKSRKTLD